MRQVSNTQYARKIYTQKHSKVKEGVGALIRFEALRSLYVTDHYISTDNSDLRDVRSFRRCACVYSGI
jgi:hypothetical protein